MKGACVCERRCRGCSENCSERRGKRWGIKWRIEILGVKGHMGCKVVSRVKLRQHRVANCNCRSGVLECLS